VSIVSIKERGVQELPETKHHKITSHYIGKKGSFLPTIARSLGFSKASSTKQF
jgi:hypothetical protein